MVPTIAVTFPIHHCNFLLSLPLVSLDSDVNNFGEFFPLFSLGFPMTFQTTPAAYKPGMGNATGFIHGIPCTSAVRLTRAYLIKESQTAHLCKLAAHYRLVMKQGASYCACYSI